MALRYRRLIFASVCILPCVQALAALKAQSPAGQTRNDDQILQRAMQAMDRGDLPAARLLLKRLNTSHPRNYAVEESLGEIAAAENDWNASARWFELAVHDEPTPNAEVLANLGVAYWKTNRPREALRILEKAEQLSPANAQTEALLGEVEEFIGHFDLAARHMVKAAEIDSTEQRWNDAGLEFLRHWSFDPAERLYRDALVRFPGSTRLRYGLAIALYGAQHYDQAIPLLAQLVQDHPEEQSYSRLFGESCAALTDGETSLCSEFVAYAERPAMNPELMVMAATWLMHSGSNPGNEQHAATLLQNALKQNASLFDGQYQMGLLQQHAANWAGSIPYLRAAIRLKPQFAQAHYRLGLALSHTGQKQEAGAEMQTQQHLADAEKASLDQRLNEIQTIVVKSK